MYRFSSNLGASNFWNPQGLSRPVMGLLYLFTSLLPSPMPLWQAQKQFHLGERKWTTQIYNSVINFTDAFNSVMSAVTPFYINTSRMLDLFPSKQNKKAVTCMRFLLHSTNWLWGKCMKQEIQKIQRIMFGNLIYTWQLLSQTHTALKSNGSFITAQAGSSYTNNNTHACIFTNVSSKELSSGRLSHYQAFLTAAASLRTRSEIITTHFLPSSLWIVM
jgi:hypothetical protein